MDTSKSNFNNSGAGNKSTFDFTKQSWKDDVTFLVEGKHLYASKSVLAIFSPVFESMFGSNFKEKEDNEVPLPGKKADDFLEFLHCLYPNSGKSVSKDNVLKVLPLADEYQTLPLLEKCEKTLNQYIRNKDGTLSIQELLQCYNIATCHGLSEVKCLSVEEILYEDDFEILFSEAEQIMDKDTLLNLKSNIISRQAIRLGDVTTKFVKLSLTTSKTSRSISGFENAKGAILEHTIANVFDPCLKDVKYSKPVKIWNASFTIRTSVIQKAARPNEQSEKYLSLYLCCTLPGGKWSCEVMSDIVLENVFAVKNQMIARQEISNVFKSPGALSWGYASFGKLSQFLIGTPENAENYTGKVVVYILAKEPVEEPVEENQTL